jgi:hypothetical protein
MPGVGAGFGAYIDLIPGASLVPGLAAYSEDFQIFIGDLVLQDFEEPDQIAGGTTQTIATHEYAGGTRTKDTYGAVPKDPTFSGRMMGPTAEQRAQALDVIVEQGLAVTFTYSQHSYLVVLKDLTWSFINYYDVAYTLTMEVIADYGLVNPASLSTDLDNIMNEDIASMTKSVTSYVGGLV